MARFLYGCTSADYATAPGGLLVPGAQYTVWSARTGGSQIVDLTTDAGTPATLVTASSTGLIAFYGPDAVKTPIWLQPVAGGERTAVVPLDNIGEACSLEVGTVTTGAAGSDVVVAITGDAPNQTIDITIPRGDTGAAGATAAALTTKGDVLSHDGANGVRVAVGANETVLEADSTAAAGVKWGSAKAVKSTVGNLVPENVATGTDTSSDTTGWTTTGATIASSTDVAYRGTRSLKVTATSAGAACRAFFGGSTAAGTLPVVAGIAHTLTFRARAFSGLTGRQISGIVYWFTSAGVAASLASTPVAAQTLTDSAWNDFTATLTPPADAAFASVRISGVTSYLEIGQSFYLDTAGFWLGAGGLWVSPGVPVPNLGIRANPADATQVQVWNPGNSTWITV